MRRFAITVGAGALLGLSGLAAQAMPLAANPEAQPLVQTVAQGCGPGGFRGPGGFCRGGYGGPRRFYGGPGYGPRRFGPGYGPRRFGGPRPGFYRY